MGSGAQDHELGLLRSLPAVIQRFFHKYFRAMPKTLQLAQQIAALHGCFDLWLLHPRLCINPYRMGIDPIRADPLGKILRRGQRHLVSRLLQANSQRQVRLNIAACTKSANGDLHGFAMY